MKIAVITPFCSEPTATLDRCVQSVLNQTIPVTHILVGDGATCFADRPNTIITPVAHSDYGDTPRLIGTISAYTRGFDAVCWLDADCWFDNNHVEQLSTIMNRDVASVVTASRRLWHPDGSLLAELDFESNGEDFCDTNCYMIARDALPEIAMKWGFKPIRDSVIGDRFVWEAAKNFPRAHVETPTVNYETKIAVHYLQRGEAPPDGARIIIHNHSHFVSKPYEE